MGRIDCAGTAIRIGCLKAWFPSCSTRRSSELHGRLGHLRVQHQRALDLRRADAMAADVDDVVDAAGDPVVAVGIAAARSEEHTSELQSRPRLVCRLLLDKKSCLTASFTFCFLR